MNIGHMNFFSIDQCGLYRVGLDKVYGCDSSETFDLILEWVKGRSLASTIPWDPSTAKDNKSKCYCKDIHKDVRTGDYFIVLWKSDTGSSGTMWGAKEDNQTGTGDVVKYTSTYKGGKVIWGRPCYYWVVPSQNLIVSIKFEHSVCDAKLFRDYIIACITNRVKHKNKNKEHTEKGFVRLSFKGQSGDKYSYRFGMSLMSLNTSNSKLQELANKVTHIVRRETILVNSKDERAEWVKKFTDVVPFVSAKPKSKQRKIEIKAEARPTVNEIREIIATNASENRKPSDWDNVGFDSGTGVTWVDRYRLRDSIVVPGELDSLLSASELCRQILKKRSEYIDPIKGEERLTLNEVAGG